MDLPAFHAGELMVKARKKLFKMGWKQMSNGRLDCIEKIFGDYIIGTIWAGDQLLFNAHKVNSERDQYGNRIDYVPLNHPVIEEAKAELRPLFDRIVKRNKKRWDKEIKEYEEGNNLKFPRNERYGV